MVEMTASIDFEYRCFDVVTCADWSKIRVRKYVLLASTLPSTYITLPCLHVMIAEVVLGYPSMFYLFMGQVF